MSDAVSRPDETPLESWKAIAAHLNRDVRTVKRWESSEGMPVHRHRHLTRSSVYAYPSELDAWRVARSFERPLPVRRPSQLPVRAVVVASLATIVLLSGGHGWMGNSGTSGAQERGIVIRQVWAGPDAQADSIPTADGRFFFTDWTTGDIASKNPATGEMQHLTRINTESAPYAQGFGVYPVASPDGAQVAYTWLNTKAFAWELRVTDLKTGTAEATPRVVFDRADVRYLRGFAWFPDGTRMLSLLVREEDTNQIAVIDVAAGSARVVKSLEWRYPLQMSLSPDGRYIAYDAPVRQDAADRDIFVLATDSGQEIPLVQHPAIDYGPIWTPDSRAVVFASDRRGDTGLWMIPVTEGKPTGSPQLVKPDMGKASLLGFSRDRSFFYTLQIGTEDVYVADLNPEAAQISGAPMRLTERFLGSNLAAVWSPDGRRIAYVSRRGPVPQAPGSMVVVIRSVDTGTERDLFSMLSFNRARPVVRWFPDGRSLLLTASDVRERWHLYRMDAQTGSTRRVSAGAGLGAPGFAFQPPVLSRDGRTSYYLQINERPNAHPTQSLMAYDLRTGQQKELFQSTTHLLVPALSRNGRQLAFVTSEQNSALVVMPAGGGAPRELFRADAGRGQVVANSLAWTHDDRFILFVRRSPDDRIRGQLWRIAADGGTPERLSPIEMEGLSFPDVSPDGRRLTFSTGRNSGRGEVWMMQNFLPADVSR